MRPVTVLPTADGVLGRGQRHRQDQQNRAYHLVNVEIKALPLSCASAIPFWTEHFC